MGVFSRKQARIRDLAKRNDVIIIAHNYQAPEVQDVADIVGDSLVLAMKARDAENENILFCGVDFMAESAKALSPDKKVIHPVPGSICPMAHMVDVEGLKALKAEHPGAEVIAYVNTTAEVKAHVDICCTSANAVKVARSVVSDEVIFVPDSNLGRYVQAQVPEKDIILWAGYCHVHQDITMEQVMELRKLHPAAEVMVHPECTLDVIDLADVVTSTEGMLRYALSSDSSEFIVATERELCHRLRLKMPGKRFYPIETALCPNMKKITLDNVLSALEDMGPLVELDPDVIEGNRPPLERMLVLE